MARRQALCYACPPTKATRQQAVDSHHVIPVEYDGPEDGKQVDVCPSCHDLVHNVAEHYSKTGVMRDDLTPNQRLLVNYIVQAKARFQASGKTKADNARNQVQVGFSNEELAALHELKRRLGFRSLERLLKHLVFQEIVKQRSARR